MHPSHSHQRRTGWNHQRSRRFFRLCESILGIVLKYLHLLTFSSQNLAQIPTSVYAVPIPVRGASFTSRSSLFGFFRHAILAFVPSPTGQMPPSCHHGAFCIDGDACRLVLGSFFESRKVRSNHFRHAHWLQSWNLLMIVPLAIAFQPGELIAISSLIASSVS